MRHVCSIFYCLVLCSLNIGCVKFYLCLSLLFASLCDLFNQVYLRKMFQLNGKFENIEALISLRRTSFVFLQGLLLLNVWINNDEYNFLYILSCL